jgi:hypothetical protein
MKERDFLQSHIRFKPPLPAHRLRAEGRKVRFPSRHSVANMRGGQSAIFEGTNKAVPHYASFVLQDVFDVSSKGFYPSAAGASFSV